MSRKICSLTVLLFILSCKQNSAQHAVSKNEKPSESNQTTKQLSPDTKISDKDYELGSKTLKSIQDQYMNSQTFITDDEAVIKWGQNKFDSKTFVHADEKTKSSMIADFLKSKVAIGQPYDKIEDLVGPRTGYFLDEQIVAVIFIEGKPQNKNGPVTDTYQLVFFPDKDGKISDVRIHKQ